MGRVVELFHYQHRCGCRHIPVRAIDLHVTIRKPVSEVEREPVVDLIITLDQIRRPTVCRYAVCKCRRENGWQHYTRRVSAPEFLEECVAAADIELVVGERVRDP